MKALEIKEFFELSAQHPVIDVRTPAEFDHGHIPGAINIPLFNNEERAEIGTLYKQQGRKPAMLRGMELITPKFPDFLKAAQQASATGTLLVHCWRGGMRSGGMAWLFNWYGFNVFTLKGGYKSFRHMVLDTFAKPYQIKVLGGRTGSGKTLILHELAKQGQTILDLEGLAHHKGSAFGSLGEEPQPTQEMFENIVAVNLLKIPSASTIWVEDESHNIGKRVVPIRFFEQMRKAKVYYVDIPIEERVNYLVEAYGKYNKEELKESIDRITKRLGPQHAKAAKEAIETGDMKTACEISLVYYDKSYTHGLNKREPSTIISKSFSKLEPAAIAKALI